jgi:hypothetical protein
MSQPQQPQSIDPCASIRQDIEDTKKTINDDQLELSHFPEDLTAAQKAQLMQEITDLKQKLGGWCFSRGVPRLIAAA